MPQTTAVEITLQFKTKDIKMWKCCVIIFVCVVMKFDDVTAAKGTYSFAFLGYNGHMPYWEDYEDVDDDTDYNYEEYIADKRWKDRKTTLITTSTTTTTTAMPNTTKRVKKYNSTENNEKFNNTAAYNNTRSQPDNNTDLLKLNDADWKTHNQTEMTEHNQTAIIENRFKSIENQTKLLENWTNVIDNRTKIVKNQTNTTENRAIMVENRTKTKDDRTNLIDNQNKIVEKHHKVDLDIIRGQNLKPMLTESHKSQNDTGQDGQHKSNKTRKAVRFRLRYTEYGVRLPYNAMQGGRYRPPYIGVQKYPPRIRPNVFHYKITNYAGYQSKCPNNTQCIRKCCPKGTAYDMKKAACIATTAIFDPPVWNSYSLMEGVNASEKFHVLEGRVNCKRGDSEHRIPVTNVTRVFRLQSDGTLLVESPYAVGPELEFKTNKYCIDLFIPLTTKTPELNAFICHVKDAYEVKTHFVLTGTCMLITCSLVLLRVIAFAWLPELHTLHGIILTAYLVSFSIGFSLLGSKLLLMNGQNISRYACVGLTFVIHFFILSAFFWRNIMCYDIWWTFSGKRAMSGRGATSRKRLYTYCAYAFGGPTVLTGIMAAFEYSNFPQEHPLMPKLMAHGCNSLFGQGKLVYFYGPIIVLFIVNLILFTLTSLKIAAVKKETKKVLKPKDLEAGKINRERKRNAKRFALYVKLFTVMVFLEVNWILEIVTIFYPEAEIILQVSDMYNILVLVIIFVNFLCQKQTWRIINKRYRRMRGLPVSMNTTGVWTTTRRSMSTTSQEDSQAPDCRRYSRSDSESRS